MAGGSPALRRLDMLDGHMAARPTASATTAAASVGGTSSSGSRPPRRPNIILLMTDQHRGDCLGIDPGCPAPLLTPNLDFIGLSRRGRRSHSALSRISALLYIRNSLRNDRSTGKCRMTLPPSTSVRPKAALARTSARVTPSLPRVYLRAARSCPAPHPRPTAASAWAAASPRPGSRRTPWPVSCRKAGTSRRGRSSHSALSFAAIPYLGIPYGMYLGTTGCTLENSGKVQNDSTTFV
jgi:hypothetical protein